METDSCCAQSIPARRVIKNLDNENTAFCSEARCGFVNFLIRELLLIDVLLAHRLASATSGHQSSSHFYAITSTFFFSPLKLEICFFYLNDHSFFQKLLISEGPLGIMKRNNAMKPNKKVLGQARGTWLTIQECHAYRISPCWTQVMSPDPSNISLSYLHSFLVSPKMYVKSLSPSEFYCPQHSLHYF